MQLASIDSNNQSVGGNNFRRHAIDCPVTTCVYLCVLARDLDKARRLVELALTAVLVS